LTGGKKQKSLTAGWEVLGLSKENATRIWEEEKKIGFMSDRETMYGGQSRKYDKKGRQIDEKGSLVDPSEAEDDDVDDNGGDDDNSGGAVSNVHECSNCGFTMFVAQGRESKFFGSGFKCPECGAPKSDFKARDQFDE
jgi:rubredoxin